MTDEALGFDTEKLTSYLIQHIKGFEGPITLKKFEGGQSNPTFLILAKSGEYVIRSQPPGVLLKSAHAVDREYRVIKALHNTEVPVARAYHLCEDKEVIGSMFYVMSYEKGQIFWKPSFPELAPQKRRAYFMELVRVLAAIHDVDLSATGLSDFGRPSHFFERQINLWTKQYRAAETQPIPAMEFLIDWLPEHCPENDGQLCLVHGDYRLDNVIFSEQGPHAIAVLDWELSSLGHPLADLAYFCMCHRLPQEGHIFGFDGLDRADFSVPYESEIIEQYCSLRGIAAIENWHFYLAFSFFRLAAIVQGVAKRAIDGNATNDTAKESGAFVPILAKLATDLIEKAEQTE